jgi:hypothetical protein
MFTQMFAMFITKPTVSEKKNNGISEVSLW